MRSIVIITALVALTAATGCARQTFTINGNSGTVNEDMQIFFVGGVGQSKDIDAAQVCGSAEQVAKVETETSILDGFISILSSNIITPRTARVFCTTRTASAPEDQ